jgi:TPR repeat protein
LSPAWLVVVLAVAVQPVTATDPEAQERACKAGDGATCRALGSRFADGPWRERDYFRALDLLARGCELRDAQSCVRQALMLARKQGRAVAAPAEIDALYEKACGAGDVHGCYLTGLKYLPPSDPSRDKGTKDLARALAIFDRACDAGDGEACGQLAGMYGRGDFGVAKDAARAAEHYRRACDAGRFCGGLALAYANGDGVAKDDERAAALFARVQQDRLLSCEKGDADDCFRLGASFREGRLGETKDLSRAEASFGRACELGDAYGCRDQRMMLDGPFGAATRDTARVEALRKREVEIRERLCDAGAFNECLQAQSPRAQYQACEHGDPEACYRLGRSYLDRNMGDTPRAAHFYQKGCDLGTASSASSSRLFTRRGGAECLRTSHGRRRSTRRLAAWGRGMRVPRSATSRHRAAAGRGTSRPRRRTTGKAATRGRISAASRAARRCATAGASRATPPPPQWLIEGPATGTTRMAVTSSPSCCGTAPG